MHFYTIIEIQENAEGTRACLPFIFTEYDEALARFYSICAAAAKSAIPYHSAHVLRSDGYIIEQHIFDRRAK